MEHIRLATRLLCNVGGHISFYTPIGVSLLKKRSVLKLFINIWFAIGRLNKYILYVEGLSKGTQATQSFKWNKIYKWKMAWNTQDTNLSWYVPKVNVDHTISGQETAISTLDNSVITPRDNLLNMYAEANYSGG